MLRVTNYSGLVGSGTRTATAPNTTGLGLWVDYANTTKLTTSGANITTATDQGAFNLRGTTGGLQTKPTFAAAAQNGNGAAVFTVNAGTAARQVFNAAGTGGIYCMFVAMNVNSTGTSTTVGAAFSLNAALTIPSDYIADVGSGMGFQWASDTQVVLANTTNTAWHIYTMRGTSGTQSYSVDGGQITGTGTTAGANGGNGFTLNGNGTSTVGEIRAFYTFLGTDDAAKEEGYLAWKWGLQGNLPSNHPYKNAPP